MATLPQCLNGLSYYEVQFRHISVMAQGEERGGEYDEVGDALHMVGEQV